MRLIFFVIVMTLLMAVLMWRLQWLTTYKATHYLKQLDPKDVKYYPKTVPTLRGDILDRNDVVLARVTPSFDICVSYSLTELFDPHFWQNQCRLFFKTIYKDGEKVSLLPSQQKDGDVYAFLEKYLQQDATKIKTGPTLSLYLLTFYCDFWQIDVTLLDRVIQLSLDNPTETIVKQDIFIAAKDELKLAIRNKWQGQRNDYAYNSVNVLMNIYQYVADLASAEVLVAEIAQLTNQDRSIIMNRLVNNNKKIYQIRLSRARRVWYNDPTLNSTHLVRPNYASNAESQISADFIASEPNPFKRLALIYRPDTAVQEMNLTWPICDPVSHEMGLTVENHFFNVLPSSNDGKPLASVEWSQTRQYPQKEVACHIIGAMQYAGIDDITPLDFSVRPTQKALSSYLSGNEKKGLWGIERIMESYLRGSRGWFHEKQVKGETIEINPPVKRVLGKDVRLTIDVHLQRSVQKILADASNYMEVIPYPAGAVVIDVDSGDILASASYPDFDLGQYRYPGYYNKISLDTKKPLLNRALCKEYNPGSTIKPTIMLGVLEAPGQTKIKLNTSLLCTADHRQWGKGPTDIHNHGWIQAVRAIRVSCNYYFALMGKKLGPRYLHTWLKLSGWGSKIIAWPEQAVPDYRWSREIKGHIARMNPVTLKDNPLPNKTDCVYMGIGRGALNGSVLHIANSAATIARGGLFLSPKLILSPSVVQRENQIAVQAQLPTHIKAIEKGMVQVIYHKEGTAFQALTGLKDIWHKQTCMVYGKTGSTDYSIFMCYAREQQGAQRTIAIGVVIESQDKYGGEAAAPITREILKAAAQWGYLPAADL
jgi:cell division protein FtsI/penicillin-binding protein 2